MDFKEKMIYILVGLLILSNLLWFIDRLYVTHESYNYDYSITNENKNINSDMKGGE